MSDTIHHALPLLAASQAQKHVTLNEALVQIDAILQLSVVSSTAAAPPSAPADGSRYIVPAAGSGPFTGRAGQIAWFDADAWRFLTPRSGWLAFVADVQQFLVHDDTNWRTLPLGIPDMVGINVAANSARRLSVASGSTLLTHEGTDHRLVINKAQGSDTATVVFQNSFSGRAEFGLSGDDFFSLKVSADGTQWRTALTVDPATGNISTGGSAAGLTPGAPLHVVADGDAHVLLAPQAGGNNRESYIDFGATFDTGVDTTPRRSARLRAGYAGGGLGTEFLSFSVGGAAGANDAPIERARLSDRGLNVTGHVKPAAVAKAALPSATQAGAGAMIMVTDEAAGPVIAFSDGIAWRRVTDRVVVS